MAVAIITGASRGLGYALAHGLATAGWDLVVDGRDPAALAEAAQRLGAMAVPGDVTDPVHRAALVAAADRLGGTDLLVNNAGILGPSPQPALAEYPLDALRDVYEVNVVAPLALTQLLLPDLRRRNGTVVNVTSDAAVKPYQGWGGYGSAKAALEQASRVLRRRGAVGPRLVGRPGRPAYPHAPGSLPGRGHQRPARAGDGRTGLPAPARRPARVRPHPAGRRTHRGRQVNLWVPAVDDVTLPAALEAHQPPEARGLARDRVRLLAGTRDGVLHRRMTDLPDLLRPGDVVVVNTSATIPAAVPTVDGLVLHFSTEQTDGRWLVEVRHPTGRYPEAAAADRYALRGGATVTLREPYSAGRLWAATVDTADVLGYLYRYGRPIRYGYVPRSWPLSAYQTVFATHPGSAEMPSAGRPFSHELVTRLIGAGVLVVPLVLHTGVASAEAHERPYPERFLVPARTATVVNQARADGGRVVAIGTTVVRALESAVRPQGTVAASEGWTDLVVTPERGVRAIDGLLTGFHEPRASHLDLLAAVAGAELLEQCYAEALAHGYLWHEFGDVNLLLP